MKTHILLAFVGLATGFVLPAFGQQKGMIDPKIEQQIRVLDANYELWSVRTIFGRFARIPLTAPPALSANTTTS